MKEYIYLMDQRVGDGPWETLNYCLDECKDWAEVDPRSIAVDGFPVYRRLVKLNLYTFDQYCKVTQEQHRKIFFSEWKNIKRIEQENSELRAKGSPIQPEDFYSEYNNWIKLQWSQRLSQAIDQSLSMQKETKEELYKLKNAIIELQEEYKKEHPMHEQSNTLQKMKEIV